MDDNSEAGFLHVKRSYWTTDALQTNSNYTRASDFDQH